MVAPPNTSSRIQIPWVTLILIFLNLGASLLTAMDHQVVVEYAFNPSQPSLLTAFTNLFLHSNVVHLLGNMVFLAAVGPWAESVAGRLPYTLIYFCGGLVGVGAHFLMMRAIHSSLPLMGASGAIASCAGYCAIRFMSHRVPLAPKLNVTVGAVTLIWVALQGIGVFVKVGNDAGGTAFWTHIAGFVSGLLISLVLRAPNQAKLQFGHDLLDKMGDRGPGALLHAADAHLATHPGDARALREKATALRQMGDFEHEGETLSELLEVTPANAKTHVVAELVECKGLDKVSAIKRIQLAEGDVRESPVLAKLLLRSVIVERDSDYRPDAIMSLVSLTEGEEREELLADLAANHALHPVTEAARARGLLP